MNSQLQSTHSAGSAWHVRTPDQHKPVCFQCRHGLQSVNSRLHILHSNTLSILGCRPTGRRMGEQPTMATHALMQPAGSSPTKTEGGTGVFILMLINVVLFLLDHVLHLPVMRTLYLNHSYPQAWQWLSHMFCHANWGHISNNLFLLLTFGRLVEDTEGPWGVAFVYIVCGLGAALASYLLSPKAAVSLGASGAIFGLFAVSVLSRLSSFNLKRLLESVVLGQFVIRQVWDEVRQQVAGGLVVGGLHVSHLAHLGGALAGVLLVLLLQGVPSPPEQSA